ncbi:MAG: glycosyltransferase [Patiriisocius sp.]|uniref:glycosyltransferase n=1 Tax=Patiriisocius sp. TaxID=2822396 RepID=UPI003EF6526A
MRVLQLIDSLEAGGAERVAVTFANALSSEIEFSAIAVTRKEGILKQSILKDIPYIFVDKKATFDLSALKRLKKFVQKNNIDIVHAHTTSYFFASLLKLTMPRIKIIWHEHQGNRVRSGRKENRALYGCSKLFSGILTVNEPLKIWCEKNLSTSKVTYLPNFVSDSNISEEKKKRENVIVCVANLKAPKNHINLLKAFKILNEEHPDWKLKLIGKDFRDDYSRELKDFVDSNRLADSVIFNGVVANVPAVLDNASIGVLSSRDEGLPMALLEYGTSGLAVVCTNVGQCPKVIGTFGTIVDNGDSFKLANALMNYVENENRQMQDGQLFKKHIISNYGVSTVLPQLLDFYKNT